MFVDKQERPSGEAKTFSEVMNKAADLIRDRGRAKYTLRDADGRICMWAATFQAEHGRPVQPFRDSALDSSFQRRLTAFLGGGYSAICHYNNNHTQEEVISMLRRAAKEA